MERGQLKSQIEQAIETLDKAVADAQAATRPSFGRSLLGKLTTTNQELVGANIRKLSEAANGWRVRGRALAGGTINKELDPQAALDTWRKQGQIFLTGIAEQLGIDSEITIGRMVWEVTADSAKDLRQAAVTVAGMTKPLAVAVGLVAVALIVRKAL